MIRQSVRVRSRALAVHAAVVGGGWFVIAFLSLVIVLPARPGWIENLPISVQGVGLTVTAVAAVPLAWPIYIAVGLCEGRLAERVRVGDAVAVGAARRLLHVQAGAFGLAGIAVAALGLWVRALHGAGYIALAWLPLLAIAGAHLWTARRVSRSSGAWSPSPR